MPSSAGSRQASRSPSITWRFHEAKVKQHSDDAGADRHQLDALLRRYPRLIGGNGGDQQHTLMQDAIMAQVMRQGERDACARGRENRCRPGQPNGRRVKHPCNEVFLALA
jgi:hypothetical protein